MITRKLDITDVLYSLDDETAVHSKRFFGKTSSHQFMKELMKENPERIVKVHSYTKESRVFQIEEEKFMQIAKEIEKE